MLIPDFKTENPNNFCVDLPTTPLVSCGNTPILMNPLCMYSWSKTPTKREECLVAQGQLLGAHNYFCI